MVKGIQRQVVVVNSPDQNLFEQAIFILKDGAEVTDEALLREANKAIHGRPEGKKRKLWLYGPAWACFGAAATGFVWLLTTLF